jgi:glutamine synthetase adenylyltransferase
LRRVEGRLRVFHNRTLDELPENEDDLEKLARRLGCEKAMGHTAADVLRQMLDWHTTETRNLFKEIFRREQG